MRLSLGEGDYAINEQVNVPLPLVYVMAGCWWWPSGLAPDGSAADREPYRRMLHEDLCANLENCWLVTQAGWTVKRL